MTCLMQRKCAHHGEFSLYLELEPLEPEEPEVPEPPEEPGDFDALLPDIPDEEVPLAPELWSPARRSQPAKAILSAATINKTCDVLTSGFIVAPFTKNGRCVVLDHGTCEKFFTFLQTLMFRCSTSSHAVATLSASPRTKHESSVR